MQFSTHIEFFLRFKVKLWGALRPYNRSPSTFVPSAHLYLQPEISQLNQLNQPRGMLVIQVEEGGWLRGRGYSGRGREPVVQVEGEGWFFGWCGAGSGGGMSQMVMWGRWFRCGGNMTNVGMRGGSGKR